MSPDQINRHLMEWYESCRLNSTLRQRLKSARMEDLSIKQTDNLNETIDIYSKNVESYQNAKAFFRLENGLDYLETQIAFRITGDLKLLRTIQYQDERRFEEKQLKPRRKNELLWDVGSKKGVETSRFLDKSPKSRSLIFQDKDQKIIEICEVFGLDSRISSVVFNPTESLSVDAKSANSGFVLDFYRHDFAPTYIIISVIRQLMPILLGLSETLHNQSPKVRLEIDVLSESFIPALFFVLEQNPNYQASISPHLTEKNLSYLSFS